MSTPIQSPPAAGSGNTSSSGDLAATFTGAFEPRQAEVLAAAFAGMQAEIASLRAMLSEALARPAQSSDEVPREHLVVLAAAVACVFGKRARIRSARRVPHPGASPWAQQGRVFVQASHNLVHRR